MRFYKFQVLTTDRSYTFNDLSYDVSDLFLSLEENPFISSVDIASFCGQKAFLLIGTEILTIPELEAILVEKFSETGRDPKNYILLVPDKEV